ncbi:hypothetical protein AB0L40_04885 [Patulibacter sp. NPDC049589]
MRVTSVPSGDPGALRIEVGAADPQAASGRREGLHVTKVGKRNTSALWRA